MGGEGSYFIVSHSGHIRVTTDIWKIRITLPSLGVRNVLPLCAIVKALDPPALQLMMSEAILSLCYPFYQDLYALQILHTTSLVDQD